MFIKALAFTCLVKAQINEIEINETEDKIGSEYDVRALPSTIPVVFENTEGGDSCSYVEQPNGSIVISTMHNYKRHNYCHKYWKCDDPNHKMFFKWNRVQMRQSNNCTNDWARIAWGNEQNDQEILCTKDNELSSDHKLYKNTGGQGSKKIKDFC